MASGNYRPEYERLEYDRIFLIDRKIKAFHSQKVTYLQMDALEARQYFIDNKIFIDCLVCLCESRGEGGESYAMCSDQFMGYYMPVLNENFIWICNDSSYYSFSENSKNHPPKYKGYWVYNRFRKQDQNPYQQIWKLRNYPYNLVSLDLPYVMTQLTENDPEYISPSVFSNLLSEYNPGIVYKMQLCTSIRPALSIGKTEIRLINDSIWNHYNELDCLFISFKVEEKQTRDWFESIPKVRYSKQEDFSSCLEEARKKGYKHIGFTPHYWYQYERPYQKVLEDFCLNNKDDIIMVDFFYLNSWFKTRFILKAAKTVERAVAKK